MPELPDIPRADILEDEKLGRYLVANTPILKNTTILSCLPYAFAIFDSHKKRVCAVCLAFNDTGAFHLHCRNCDQVYLCSPACLATLLAQGHHVLCSPLRRLATFKAPQHEKSILKILLFTLFHRNAERGKNVHLLATIMRDAAAEPPPDLDPPQSSPLTNDQPPLSTSPLPPSSSPRTPASTIAPIAMLDKATLQQHIQQRLRMFTNQSLAASSDDLHSNDDDHSFHTTAPRPPNPRNRSPLLRPATTTFSPPSPRQNPAHSFTPPPTSIPTSQSNTPFTPPTWEQVEALQSHYADWPAEDTRDWRKTKNFIIRILEDCGLLEDADRVPQAPRGDPTDFVLNLISKIESNGFGLWTKMDQCMGRAIFPKASYFNHSCDPNTQCVQDAAAMTIKTRRDVKQNDPLTISYIDTNMPLHARRARLQSDYFFWCTCERCVAEENRQGTGGGRGKVTYERSFVRDRGKGTKSAGRGGPQRQVQPQNQVHTGQFQVQPQTQPQEQQPAEQQRSVVVTNGDIQQLPSNGSNPLLKSPLLTTSPSLPSPQTPMLSGNAPVTAVTSSPTQTPIQPRPRSFHPPRRNPLGTPNPAEIRQRTANNFQKKVGRGGVGYGPKRRNTVGGAGQLHQSNQGQAVKSRSWSLNDPGQ